MDGLPGEGKVPRPGARDGAGLEYPVKPLLYISIAVASFLMFIIVFAPATPVWSLIRETVHERVPDLNVYRVSGTIWSGESEIQFRRFPPSLVTWQLSPVDLIKGVAKIRVRAQGEGHLLEAEVALTASNADIKSLHGTIDSNYVNVVSEEFGFTFSGNLEIRELSISADRIWITGAAGTAHWTGGRIIITTAAGPQSFVLPPLQALFLMRQQRLILDITHQQQTLISIILRKGGWAEIAIKARMFVLANLPMPGGSDRDETILLIEEKIL
ncbi:MAG: type II secretion system protein N [Proteobacteria bacterium]|nr:type II secretion system protein N [Pseudomonadota bacterium]